MVDPVLCRYRRGLGLDLVVWRIPDENGKLLHWGRNPGLDPVLRKADVFYSRRHDQDDDGAFGGGAFGPELPRAAGLDIDAMRAKAIELVGPDVVPLADKLQRLGFAQRFWADHRSVMATMAMVIFVAGLPKREQAVHLAKFKLAQDLPDYVFSHCQRYRPM